MKNRRRTSEKCRRETPGRKGEKEARNSLRRSRTQTRWSGRAANLISDRINAVNRRGGEAGGDLIKNFRQFVRSILQAICNWRVHRRRRANGLKSGPRGQEGSVSDRSVCLARGVCQDGRNGKRKYRIDGEGRAIKKEKLSSGDRKRDKTT